MAKLYGGTIKYMGKDKDGKGKYWLDMPCGKDPITGKYRRKREMFHGTKKQAEHRLGELRSELESGKAPDADTVMFADWCEKYLAVRVGTGGKRPATFKNDRKIAKHLVARLGEVRLVDITPAMVDTLYTSMREDGVGDTTILQCHKLLKRVMKYALVNNIVFRNPCDAVEPPKKPTPKRKALSPAETHRLGLIASSGTPTARKTAVYIGLATGCRMGECLGLVWGNVELEGEHPYIYFIQQYTQQCEIAPLKTDDDDNPVGRVYPLDETTAAVLRAWRAVQRVELNALGIEQGSKTPVVTNSTGGFQDPARFGEWFRSFCVANGFGRWLDDEGREIVELMVGEDAALHPGCVLEWRDAEGWPCDESGRRFSRVYKRNRVKRHYSGLRYHELRHTHYTLRLADGMDIPTAQALGGWSDPRVLLKTYAHPVSENIWASAGFMDNLTN